MCRKFRTLWMRAYCEYLCVNQERTHGREGWREGVNMCFRVYACVHVLVYLCARVRLWWCILLCLQLHRIVNLCCWSSVSRSACEFARVTSHAVTDLCETERVRGQQHPSRVRLCQQHQMHPSLWLRFNDVSQWVLVRAHVLRVWND